MRATGLYILILALMLMGAVGCGSGSGVAVIVTGTDTLLVAFDRDGHFYGVDLATGDAVPLIQTFIDNGAGVEKIGVVSGALYNPANGVMWLATGGNASCPACIVQLNLSTGEGLMVADNSAFATGLPGLVIDDAGDMFSFEGDGSNLLQIDTLTGEATLAGTLVGGAYRGFGATFANNQVYFAGSQTLYTLNTATAVETMVADFILTGFPATTAGDFQVVSMTTAPDNTTYCLVQDQGTVEPQTYLATLNLATAELTFIGRTSNRLDGLVYADLRLAISIPPAASLRHDYQLNNSFDDALGGPSLVTGGGVLGPAGYTFAAMEGLSLSNGINADEYSIEMRFTLDDVAGYRKLIDYDDRAMDEGTYNSDGILCAYDDAYGPDGAFTAGVSAHVVITRTRFNVVIVYVDGVLQTTYVDCDRFTVADAAANILWFMQDDTASPGEDASGFLDFIRIYNGVLTPAQVVSLRDGGPPP